MPDNGTSDEQEQNKPNEEFLVVYLRIPRVIPMLGLEVTTVNTAGEVSLEFFFFFGVHRVPYTFSSEPLIIGEYIS